MDEIGALNALMEEYDEGDRSTPVPDYESTSSNGGSDQPSVTPLRDEKVLAAKRLNAQVLGYQAMASSRTASLDECDAVGSLLTL